jgi:hypothetical protein
VSAGLEYGWREVFQLPDTSHEVNGGGGRRHEDHVVRAGGPMRAYRGRDRAWVAMGDDRVDELVADRGGTSAVPPLPSTSLPHR